MTMKNTLLILGLAIATFYGCAGDDSDSAADSTSQTEAGTKNSTSSAQTSDSETTPSNSDANTIENLPWTFLVTGVYHNNATIGAGSGDKKNINEGHWINFYENGTYDYGIWGEKEYDGTWFYDGDTNILDLTPKGDHEQSQWRVMHKDDNLIWLGTAKYGNNSLQVQWLRREGLPVKKG